MTPATLRRFARGRFRAPGQVATVALGLNEPAALLSAIFGSIATTRSPTKRAVLVRLHQPRLPGDINGQDRGEAAGSGRRSTQRKGLKVGTPRCAKSRRFSGTTD